MARMIMSATWVVLWAVAGLAQSQVLEVRSLSGINQITLDHQWADVVYKNWDRNEIKVEGTVSISEGESDDAFDLQMEVADGELTVTSDVNDVDKLPKFLTVRKGDEVFYFRLEDGEDPDWSTVKETIGEDVIKSTSYSTLIDITLVIHVPDRVPLEIECTYGDLTITNCGNAIWAKNTYGHVIASLPNRTLPADCKLTSTYSFVDVSVLQEATMDISLHTNYGEIFSNVDFTYDGAESFEKNFNSKIAGSLNGGGRHLSLKATYSNIYLRKI